MPTAATKAAKPAAKSTTKQKPKSAPKKNPTAARSAAAPRAQAVLAAEVCRVLEALKGGDTETRMNVEMLRGVDPALVSCVQQVAEIAQREVAYRKSAEERVMRAADRVEHRVHTSTFGQSFCLRDEILRAVVDRLCAERLDQTKVLG